jgi:hypothetical protein
VELPRRHRGVHAPVHLLRVDPRGEQLAGDGVAARRGVGVAEAAGVGEDRHVEPRGDRRRQLEREHAQQVEHQLAGGARRHVAHDRVAGRIVGGDVMVDDELRHRQRARRVAELAQAASCR